MVHVHHATVAEKKDVPRRHTWRGTLFNPGLRLDLVLHLVEFLGTNLRRIAARSAGTILFVQFELLLLALPIAFLQHSIIRGILNTFTFLRLFPTLLTLLHRAAGVLHAAVAGAHALTGPTHAATTATAAFRQRNSTAQCGNQNRNHQHILTHDLLLPIESIR